MTDDLHNAQEISLIKLALDSIFASDLVVYVDKNKNEIRVEFDTGYNVSFDTLSVLSELFHTRMINIECGGKTGYCETCSGVDETVVIISEWHID